MAAISSGLQWVRLAMVRFLTFPPCVVGFALEDALIGLAVLGGAGGFGDVHDYYNPINLNYIKNM